MASSGAPWARAAARLAGPVGGGVNAATLQRCAAARGFLSHPLAPGPAHPPAPLLALRARMDARGARPPPGAARPPPPARLAPAAAYAAAAVPPGGGEQQQQHHQQQHQTAEQRHAAAAAALAQEEEEDMQAELHAVDTAIRANMLIFIAKISVYFVSMSSAMLAEAVHSLVDVANQVLLRIGVRKAEKPPTKAHPFGYSRDQFVWPLISAVGIFCCGAGISFIHGVQGLFTPHEVGPLFWNFVVLGVSTVLESHSLAVALATLRKRAERQGMSLWTYVKTGSDPAATAIMMEDGAAVAGLVIAAGCLGLVQLTGNAVWDSVGSIAVSALLGIVAVTLIQRNRKWLIGKSMPADSEALIVDYLRRQPVVRSVTGVKSEELGIRNYRFQAELAFDGAELARRCLDRVGRQGLYQALAAATAERDAAKVDALLMQFATVTVSAVGAEVDRMENDIMRIVPGVRYVDLETDRGKPLRPPSPATLERQRAALAAWQAREAAGGGGGANGGARWPPADRGAEGDHLADLVNYPLGSLTSFDSCEDSRDGSPDWSIKDGGPRPPTQRHEQQQEQPAGADGAADRPPVASGGGGGAPK